MHGRNTSALFMYVHVLKEAFSLWLCELQASHSQKGAILSFQIRDECQCGE